MMLCQLPVPISSRYISFMLKSSWLANTFFLVDLVNKASGTLRAFFVFNYLNCLNYQDYTISTKTNWEFGRCQAVHLIGKQNNTFDQAFLLYWFACCCTTLLCLWTQSSPNKSLASDLKTKNYALKLAYKQS
jgi:hypothetical protein